MQLLDSEQLEFAFQLHGITLEAQARRFYTDLWQVIQDAERASDIGDLQDKSQEIRKLCRSYFALVADWRDEQQDLHTEQDTSSHDLMIEASLQIPPFEKQFIRYALCYMELNRALIRGRARISFLSKEQNIDEAAIKDLDVNTGTGVLLDRAHTEIRDLTAKRRRLQAMRAILKSTDALMEDLGAALPSVMGPEGDRQLTLFKGVLRRLEFERAQNLARSWRPAPVRKTALWVARFFLEHRADLAIQDGLVLHSGELSLPLTVLASDERKVRAFLDTHNLPYMLFRYRSLLHLGYLLGQIGSIENLIIQHAKLSSVAAKPANDPDQARRARQTVLMPVKKLLDTQFRSLGAIFNEMEITQAALDRLFSQTRNYMASLGA